jgi:hypothetical protein
MASLFCEDNVAFIAKVLQSFEHLQPVDYPTRTRYPNNQTLGRIVHGPFLKKSKLDVRGEI